MFEGGLDYKGKQMPGIQVQAIGNTENVFILVSNRTGTDLTPQLFVDENE